MEKFDDSNIFSKMGETIFFVTNQDFYSDGSELSAKGFVSNVKGHAMEECVIFQNKSSNILYGQKKIKDILSIEKYLEWVDCLKTMYLVQKPFRILPSAGLSVQFDNRISVDGKSSLTFDSKDYQNITPYALHSYDHKPKPVYVNQNGVVKQQFHCGSCKRYCFLVKKEKCPSCGERLSQSLDIKFEPIVNGVSSENLLSELLARGLIKRHSLSHISRLCSVDSWVFGKNKNGEDVVNIIETKNNELTSVGLTGMYQISIYLHSLYVLTNVERKASLIYSGELYKNIEKKLYAIRNYYKLNVDIVNSKDFFYDSYISSKCCVEQITAFKKEDDKKIKFDIKLSTVFPKNILINILKKDFFDKNAIGGDLV